MFIPSIASTFMRFFRPASLTVFTPLLIALGGCGNLVGGGGSGPVASHGGTLLELPSRAGFVELMVEKADANAKGRRVLGKVVAYFTNKEGNAALEPVPTDVVFVDEGGKAHPMTVKTGESSAARFESEPISLALGEPTGKIEAKVGGESVSLQNRPR